jgi:GrpB-like predicted nucleotidyltransferase (UPF0157 family)
MQLVGGLRIGTAAPGNDSFYRDLLVRLPSEVRDTGPLTRFVAFDFLSDGTDPITFLGIEVESIAPIPPGLIGWDLGREALTVLEWGNGVNSVIWQEQVVWQWLDERTCAGRRRVTGEFSVRVPAEWNGTGAPAVRQFQISANAYLAPGHAAEDDGIHLKEYDPSWPAMYDEFTKWLDERLGPEVVRRIEHIGSTAIPGMVAKPVIDVLVEVPSFREARRRAVPSLNEESWEYWWYRDHMVFIRRDHFMGRRTHHVHLMQDGIDLRRRVAFRDYLRSHPADALRYAALKQQLARHHQADREHYTDAKTAFVNAIVATAMGLPPRAMEPEARSSRR